MSNCSAQLQVLAAALSFAFAAVSALPMHTPSAATHAALSALLYTRRATLATLASQARCSSSAQPSSRSVCACGSLCGRSITRAASARGQQAQMCSCNGGAAGGSAGARTVAQAFSEVCDRCCSVRRERSICVNCARARAPTPAAPPARARVHKCTLLIHAIHARAYVARCVLRHAADSL